jgi:hypothetical protein
VPAVLPPKEIPSPQESIDESRDLARAGAAYNDE